MKIKLSELRQLIKTVIKEQAQAQPQAQANTQAIQAILTNFKNELVFFKKEFDTFMNVVKEMTTVAKNSNVQIPPQENSGAFRVDPRMIDESEDLYSFLVNYLKGLTYAKNTIETTLNYSFDYNTLKRLDENFKSSNKKKLFLEQNSSVLKKYIPAINKFLQSLDRLENVYTEEFFKKSKQWIFRSETSQGLYDLYKTLFQEDTKIKATILLRILNEFVK